MKELFVMRQTTDLDNEKNSAYKSYCRFNRDMLLFEKFKVLQNQLNKSIENSKEV